MDVQTENMDPPPGDSQSSGKIRKGFKLFGKRKPGNIFSIRSKGDGNNKSPAKSKTLDGLSETAAPDPEHEPDKEKRQEVSQGEMEQAEEEALGEDGVLAAAHARTSISSASSAKSLSFLSLLRGGRRGTGDRRVHTVSQPTGRQRRGLKGLFGTVKFRSKDKEEKEEAPPSPLLMSSRANSVEIIKEDLTLTPKSQPRSLDSPETESSEPIKSFSTQGSAATTPSETVTPQVTAGNVSKAKEHVPPLPTSEPPPLVPGDNSLSSLLADISSLLTFDSISGGKDIMADVEAEWGKASSAVATEGKSPSTSPLSKPSVSSTLSSTCVSTAATVKPPPVAVPAAAASIKSPTPLTNAASSATVFSKPSVTSPVTSPSSILSAPAVKPPPVAVPAATSIKSPAPLTNAVSSATVFSKPSVSTPLTSPSSFITHATVKPPPVTVTAATSIKSSAPLTDATSSATSLLSKPSVSAPLTSPSSVITAATVKPPPVTAPAATSIKSPAPLTNTASSATFFSKPSVSPPLTSPPSIITAATVKTPPVTVLAATSTKSSAPTIDTTSSASSSTAKPSTIITTLTKSSTPTAQPVKLSTDFAPAVLPPDSIKIQSAPTPAMGTPSPPSVTMPVSVSKDSPAPAQTPVPQPKTPLAATSAPCPVTSLISTPAPCPSETLAPAKTRGSGQASVDGQASSPGSPGAPGFQAVASKANELQNESRMSLQGPPKERKTPQGKTSGLSKIPVVGGGRAGKIPVRESQQADGDASRDPPTPVLDEERSHYNLKDAGSREKLSSDGGATMLTSRHPQDQSPPQLPPQKVLSSLPRDSRIPVKHGAQPHAASQTPQAKEPHRTKIPVSKVPVRRVGTKTTASGGSTQIRK